MDGYRAVLVTTQHRGVFFGYVEDDADLASRTLSLKGARMAIKWGTRHGVAELAETGPTAQSKVGARADVPVLHDVTAVWLVTDAARERWEAVQ